MNAQETVFTTWKTFVLLFLNRNARTVIDISPKASASRAFIRSNPSFGVGRFSSGRLNDFIEKREMTQFCALSLDWLLEKVLQESVTIDSQASWTKCVSR